MGSSSKTAPIANCSPPGNITRPYGGCRAEVFCRVENALALCLIPFLLSRPNPPRGFGRALMLWFGITLTAAGVIGALLISYALVVMVPKLPSLDALINY